MTESSVPVSEKPSDLRTLPCSNLFMLTAGTILLTTGAGKFWAAFSSVKLLDVVDPILGFPFRYLMFAAALMEVAVAAACVFSERAKLTAALVAWLASSFCVYRFGLWWIGWNRPCPCLGNFADALHLSTQVVDSVVRAALIYLLVGSYGTLFFLGRRRGKRSGKVALLRQ